MARIGATLSGIERSLLNRLAEANAAVALSTLRISTAEKINSPSDDPSGFVMLSGLQSRLSTVRATMTNITAASSMVTQLQNTLEEIAGQMAVIRTELVKDEDPDNPLTAEERAESQATIDAAITAIDNLAETEIDGRRLLNGSANFVISGANSSQLTDVAVHRIRGSSVTIDGQVTTAATRAQSVYTGNASDQVTDTAVFTLSGSRGSIQVSVTALDPLGDVADEVNANSHKTGVTAAVDGGAHTLTFTSVDYGSAPGVDVEVTSGTFAVADTAGTDVVVTIEGEDYTGQGNRLSINQNGLHYALEFKDGFTGALDTITLSGSALTFALSTDVQATARLAVPGMQVINLGGISGSLDQLASGGSLSGLDTNTSQAIRVVDEALVDLARVEGTVDGFFTSSVSTASALMSDLEDDLEASIDDLNLVDSQEESQLISLHQALASNAVAGLAILNQQRNSIVTMIQAIAGLT